MCGALSVHYSPTLLPTAVWDLRNFPWGPLRRKRQREIGFQLFLILSPVLFATHSLSCFSKSKKKDRKSLYSPTIVCKWNLFNSLLSWACALATGRHSRVSKSVEQCPNKKPWAINNTAEVVVMPVAATNVYRVFRLFTNHCAMCFIVTMSDLHKHPMKLFPFYRWEKPWLQNVSNLPRLQS